MNDVNLAFSFTAGIVATINPCGFAMLPAYLSYFLGIEANSGAARGPRIGRALITGSVVSLGFLLVFGVTGVLVSAGLTAIREIVPWIAVVVGAALVVVGTAVIAGKRIDIAIPKFERGTKRRDLRSLFLFGVSYAVASISCGLPTFIVVVSTSVNGFRSGLLAFVVYALGMAITLLSLTVSLALARSSFLERLRSFVRFVDRTAGLLMVLAGGYLVVYWLTERAGGSTNWGVAVIERWSANLSNTVVELGGVRTGILLSLVVALGLIVWLVQLDDQPSDNSPERL